MLVPHTQETIARIEMNFFMLYFFVGLGTVLFGLASVFLVYLSFFYERDDSIYAKSSHNTKVYLLLEEYLEKSKVQMDLLKENTEELNLVAWDETPWTRILTFDYRPGFVTKDQDPVPETNLDLYRDTVAGYDSLNKDLDHLENAFQNAFDYLSARENVFYSMPKGRPLAPGVGFVSSTFGNRRDPFGLLMVGEFHAGIDFATPEGRPIYATAPGYVGDVGESIGGLGRNVRLYHANGFITVYGHCSKILVTEGEPVKRGQVIALVGSTGKATGAHVHYEVHTGIDPPADPEEFVNME